MKSIIAIILLASCTTPQDVAVDSATPHVPDAALSEPEVLECTETVRYDHYNGDAVLTHTTEYTYAVVPDGPGHLVERCWQDAQHYPGITATVCDAPGPDCLVPNGDPVVVHCWPILAPEDTQGRRLATCSTVYTYYDADGNVTHTASHNDNTYIRVREGS